MTEDKNLPNDPVDNEILSKGEDVVKDFDYSQEVYVEPKVMENKLISIRLPGIMLKDLRVVAERRGDIGYQQVIKTYIAEGLLRDSQRYENRIPSILNDGSNIVSVSSASIGIQQVSRADPIWYSPVNERN